MSEIPTPDTLARLKAWLVRRSDHVAQAYMKIELVEQAVATLEAHAQELAEAESAWIRIAAENAKDWHARLVAAEAALTEAVTQGAEWEGAALEAQQALTEARDKPWQQYEKCPHCGCYPAWPLDDEATMTAKVGDLQVALTEARQQLAALNEHIDALESRLAALTAECSYCHSKNTTAVCCWCLKPISLPDATR